MAALRLYFSAEVAWRDLTIYNRTPQTSEQSATGGVDPAQHSTSDKISPIRVIDALLKRG